MTTHRLNSIPRFALPYTVDDFMAALDAVWHGAPPPDSIEEATKLFGNERRAMRRPDQ